MRHIVDSVSIQIYIVHKESYRSRPKIINVKHARKSIVKLTMKDNNILKFCTCLSLLSSFFSDALRKCEEHSFHGGFMDRRTAWRGCK